MRNYDDCRCYVEHLLAEHRRLHELLRAARDAVVGVWRLDRDATGADALRVLRQVRAELAHHFAEEENGGCLEEVVSRCPTLSIEAQRIEGEHSQLLESIDRLVAQVQDGDDSLERRIAFERQFDDFCRQLFAHEAAENELLRRGFGTNFHCMSSNATNLGVLH
jgi:hypothetical protein